MEYLGLVLTIIVPMGILLLKVFILWEILGILIRVNNILRKVRRYDNDSLH